MDEKKEPISIWYFVGFILTVYGILILGAGVYDVMAGVRRDTVLADLHAGVWWGALLVILGVVYLRLFTPGRPKRS